MLPVEGPRRPRGSASAAGFRPGVAAQVVSEGSGETSLGDTGTSLTDEELPEGHGYPRFRYHLHVHRALWMKAAARSPIMIAGALVLPVTRVGMMEVSATRTLSKPSTRSWESTTFPIMQVPEG